VIRFRRLLTPTLATLAALFVGVLAARADAPVPSSGSGMLVLIDGCPGFVASGGVAPNATPPVPDSWTHNFVADWTQSAQWKFQSDPTGQKTLQAISLDASGTDAAGHTFTIKGKLVWHLLASPELWADSGTVQIRRDDGAKLVGTAVGDLEPIFDPIFTVDRALAVTATSCKLPS
jgi:hypothetical protein